jgi:hypothetical protein
MSITSHPDRVIMLVTLLIGKCLFGRGNSGKDSDIQAPGGWNDFNWPSLTNDW